MGNDSSKMEERVRGKLPKLQDTLRKCFDRPIIVTWGVVKRHTAVGSLKVYSDPARHMEDSSVMVFTFPGHNLAFSFQALSFTQDAYLCNETSVVLGGLKHAVQVYSLGAEKKLLQKLQEERNDLISELEYREQINFAYHNDAIAFVELVRRQACLGTSEKAASFTHDSTTLSDLWVHFFYTQQRDVILVPACPSSDMKAAYKGFDLSESATVRVMEKSDAASPANATDDKRKRVPKTFHVCEIKDNENNFQVKFEERDHALQLRNLVEQIQEDRSELHQHIDSAAFHERPPHATAHDTHDLDALLADHHALRAALDQRAAQLQQSAQLAQQLRSEKDALAARLAAAERARAADQAAAQELRQHGRDAARLAHENRALAERAAASEARLLRERDRSAADERKLAFLQAERARLQGEVDEARGTIAELDRDTDLLNDEIARLTLAQKVAAEGGPGKASGSA